MKRKEDEKKREVILHRKCYDDDIFIYQYRLKFSSFLQERKKQREERKEKRKRKEEKNPFFFFSPKSFAILFFKL